MKLTPIGELIKRQIEEQHVCISDFAKRINCTRSNVYDILKRDSIDVKLLMDISMALNYDFIHEIINKSDEYIFSDKYSLSDSFPVIGSSKISGESQIDQSQELILKRVEKHKVDDRTIEMNITLYKKI